MAETSLTRRRSYGVRPPPQEFGQPLHVRAVDLDVLLVRHLRLGLFARRRGGVGLRSLVGLSLPLGRGRRRRRAGGGA
jgi:hypothetical protein